MMKARKCLAVILVALVALAVLAGPALAQAKKADPPKKANPMEAWKPKFDPAGAKYKIVFSNVSHPAISGVGAGFKVRDALWEASKGQVYFDYRPFSQLGGEVEVLNLVQTGAIQGMNVSSVASTNLGPRMGVVNLPFLVNTPEKLDKFVANKEIFEHFLAGMDHQGIMGVDVTGYGPYSWISTKPIKTLAEARKMKFRIAEAAVNKSIYAAWGINPVVMPWPDVHTALQQGVIDALDHSPIVVTMDKKIELAKEITDINYAQGLFIWIFNKKWFASLPDDIKKVIVDVIKTEAAKSREDTKKQLAGAVKEAKEKYQANFYKLPDADIKELVEASKKVHKEWEPQIGADFLKKVQALMDFK